MMAGSHGHREIQEDRNADHIGPPVLDAATASEQAHPYRADGTQNQDDRLNSVGQIAPSLTASGKSLAGREWPPPQSSRPERRRVSHPIPGQ